jgi:plasmid stabilization system protein ParE
MKQWRGSVVVRTVDLLPGARVDFDESFDWYAQRSELAAVGFQVAVEEAIDRIVQDPEHCSPTSRGCRYLPLKRYPFRVIFHYDDKRVVIVAIAHAKRRPNYWRNRV